MSDPAALVPGAHLRSAVAGIRGFGRAGIPVVAVDRRRTAAGRWSRYAWRRASVPDAQSDPAGFVDALGRLAADLGSAVVYPADEAALSALTAHPPAAGNGLLLPFSGGQSLQRLRDKPGLAALADAGGLRTPETLALTTAAELRAAAPDVPFVLKPPVGPASIESAHVIRSRADLDRVLDRIPPGEPVLAQRFESGTQVSIAGVVGRDGSLVSAFQECVVRTWPADAGSFSMTISETLDAGLAESLRAICAAAGYWGLVQTDLVRSPEGTVLLDVNPRLYACLPLALACGVNLPAAWHAVVLGRPATRPAGYSPGRRYRWLEGDLTAAARGVRGRIGGPRADAGAMWAGDDPRASTLLAAGALSVRARRRIRRTG